MPRLLAAIDQLALRTSYPALFAALGACLIALVGGLAWATRLYAESRFPPRLIEGQLAFDAARYRGWYATLIESDTLGIYQRTQIVDFIFISGLLGTLFVLHLLLAKARRGEPFWHRLALWLAVLGPAIASADLWENLVTLTMLQRPSSFAPWLAPLASTLSAVKWGWSVIGTSLVAVQLAALAWHRIGRGSATRVGATQSDT